MSLLDKNHKFYELERALSWVLLNIDMPAYKFNQLRQLEALLVHNFSKSDLWTKCVDMSKTLTGITFGYESDSDTYLLSHYTWEREVQFDSLSELYEKLTELTEAQK